MNLKSFDSRFNPAQISTPGTLSHTLPLPHHPPPPPKLGVMFILLDLMHESPFSFFTDYQLEIDAQIVLTLKQTTVGAGFNVETKEILYPERHNLGLPLNGLNILFDDYNVSFNHHTKLESDR